MVTVGFKRLVVGYVLHGSVEVEVYPKPGESLHDAVHRTIDEEVHDLALLDGIERSPMGDGLSGDAVSISTIMQGDNILWDRDQPYKVLDKPYTFEEVEAMCKKNASTIITGIVAITLSDLIGDGNIDPVDNIADKLYDGIRKNVNFKVMGSVPQSNLLHIQVTMDVVEDMAGEF